MSSKHFLNVCYGGSVSEVDVKGFERIGQLQDAVKSKYAPDMDLISAPRIQLFDQQDRLIEDFEDIADDCYEKVKKGGKYLVIRTSPQKGVCFGLSTTI